MNYRETLDFLYSQLPQFQLIGAGAYKPGLQTALALDAWSGHPHRRYETVHVAGTNGKGSVSHLTAAVLQAAGYKTGLFTSPHLKDFRERIRVNGQMISEEAVCAFTERYLRARDEGVFRGQSCERPSFFELTTAMAFDFFAREAVDVAVIEVGLGGRLDSTNIITPAVSVITSISFDHMALLGDTLEAIAGEKAGIIKPGVPAVAGLNEPEVMAVFRAKAAAAGSPLLEAASCYRLTPRAFEAASACGGQCFDVESLRPEFPSIRGLHCGLGGFYIRENALTVLTALSELTAGGRLTLSEAAIREGFSRVVEMTGIRGRWESLGDRPLTICDTGHNEAGIRYVTEQLAATPHRCLRIVFGVVSDKDVAHMLSLLPADAVYYFTKASVPRALPETELAARAAAYGLHGTCYATVREALDAARAAAAPDDLIYIGGSNFVVSEI